jgi:DNA-binding CsgD family transcriptional regulator/outer membrane lipoprotein-sorting protein
MKRIFLIITIYVAAVVAGYAQIGHHFVINHKSLSLGRGGQTWCISLYNDDWAYFANNNGIYQYNGKEWTGFHLNNNLDPRAVYALPTQERVYVSGINEFGYITPNEHGFMKYQCLSDSLGKSQFIGNIWGIFSISGTIYAQGDYAIVTMNEDGSNPKMIKSSEKLCCSNVIDDILYIGSENGLKMLVGDKIRQAFGTDLLRNQRICSMLPYRDGMVIVTNSNGIYFYNGTTVSPILTGQEAIMKSSGLLCGAIYHDTLALGTIQNGVILINLATKQAEFYNRRNGMQDETVLSLRFNSRGDLWVGLDNGIDQILLSVPLTTLSMFDTSIGSGYACLGDGNNIYLGTNRGLFVTSIPENSSEINRRFTPVGDLLKGQVWGIKRFGNEILCMHDHGLFSIDRNLNIKRIGEDIGTWTVQPVMGSNDLYYVGTYDNLYILRSDGNGSWTIVTKYEIQESVCDIMQESPTEIWFMKNNFGAIRLTFDPATHKLLKEQLYDQSKGMPQLLKITTCKIGNDLKFATSKGVYRYDRNSDRIVADDDLNQRLDRGCNYLQLRTSKNYIFALTPYEIIRIPINDKGGAPKVSLPLLPAEAKPLHPCEMLQVVNDSIVIYPNYSGYTICDFSKRWNISHDYGRINKMMLTALGDSIVYACNFSSKREVTDISYNNNSVKFDFGFEISGSFVAGYSYRLNNEAWSEPSLSTTKEYTNLSEGTYTFKVKAILSDGSEQTDSITFRIRPPWYRSIAAYCIYLLLLILLGWGLYRYTKQQIRTKENRIAFAKDVEIALQKEHFESIEQKKDEHISELESEKLRTEIEHKAHEISNLLMNLSSKNEALIDIKEELKKIYAGMKTTGDTASRSSLLALQSKIESVIQSDRVLERIEKEFDLVHNNFMHKLRTAYPDISNNELLMCAYLQMNLSTKEIAPLMNLSTRGVETMRYRMRKKFGLERSEQLTEFLSKLTV